VTHDLGGRINPSFSRHGPNRVGVPRDFDGACLVNGTPSAVLWSDASALDIITAREAGCGRHRPTARVGARPKAA